MITVGLTFRDVLRIAFIFLIVLAVVGYVLFQARFLLIGPQISLNNEPALLQNERTLTLTGTATNISHLWLNGQQIFTDPRGNFEAAVILQNGYTVATLEAEDRYGRRTTLTRELVYAPMSFSHIN